MRFYRRKKDPLHLPRMQLATRASKKVMNAGLLKMEEDMDAILKAA